MLKLNSLQGLTAFVIGVALSALLAIWSVSQLSTEQTATARGVDQAQLVEINSADRTSDAIRIKTILAPDSERLAALRGETPSEEELTLAEQALAAPPPEVIATGKENGRAFALLRATEGNVRLTVGEAWNDWQLNKIEGVATYFSREGQAFDHVFFAPSEENADEG
ncbi:MAG: hypothetical protein AAF950_01270 [Pseudomonadota bacterium]